MTALVKCAAALLVLGLLLMGAQLYYERAKWEDRIRRHVHADNVNRIKELRTWISRAAAVEPLAFAKAVEPGITCKAPSLPAVALSGVIADETELLYDTFGQGLNVDIRPQKRNTNDGVPCFDLFVWSDGPNGKNEQGRGDDISCGQMVIGPEPPKP